MPAPDVKHTAGWRRRWRHSLGLRLVAWFVALAAVLALVLLGSVERLVAFGYSGVVKPVLADYVDRLAAEIGSPPDPARAQALEQRLPVRVHISGPLVSYGRAPPWHEATSDHERDADGDWVLSRRSADGHRITFSVAPRAWAERPRTVGWFALVLLLLATAVVYRAVRRLFRPIDDIRAGALRYGQGDFATPIPVRRHDELGELACQVNTMASELHGMLDAKRELLLAISHELRSPLTRARLNAELVAEGPERDALLHDLAEMRLLIEQLLEHERLSGGTGGHRALHRESTDIAGLANSVLADHFAGRPIQLQMTADVGTALIDPQRLRLALRNLLDNAWAHGQSERPPELHVQRDGTMLRFRVRDFGPGVAPEQLGRLAEAFYRPDAARTRHRGGVGLGLALSRRVAEAHGGSLALANAHPGFEATLTLRAAP